MSVESGMSWMTVGSLLAQQAELFPQRQVLTCGGRSYTYEALNAEANRYGHGLRRFGVNQGDRVCVMLPNCAEYILVWFGLAKLGAIHAAINTGFRGQALARAINLAQSEVLVVSTEYAERVVEISPELTSVRHVIWLLEDAAQPPDLGDRLECANLPDVVAADTGPCLSDIRPTDPLMFIYTSGTTGTSKAVELSHSFALHYAGESNRHMELTEDDVLFSAYPLYHVDALLTIFLAAVSCGGRAVIGRRFSVSRFWPDIKANGVTATTMMGAAMTMLHKAGPKPDDEDNPLRLIIAAPTPAFWREFEERFQLKVREAYGATECSNVVWDPLHEPHRDGACGKPDEFFEVAIVDDDDIAVPPETPGEIVVRPNVPFAHMNGYFANDAATRAAWRNLWYHTGDVGFLDGDGWLRFLGRKTDSLRRRGENISAYEVEEILQEHPAITEAAVIGVPSELTEDDVKAVLCLSDGTELDAQTLIVWCADRMARFMVPRYVEFVDVLPKSPTGKVQKHLLRDNWKTPGTFDHESMSFLR
jgi:crotonobetaine/carnitine-CoA ligase